MDETTVKDMVKDWLRSHGYDGLSSEECSCSISEEIENDGFMDCNDFDIVDCKAWLLPNEKD
jgi:hypothetical protein